MPRPPRIVIPDVVYHVLNRANERARIFHSPSEYRLFRLLLREAARHVAMRLLAYCVMPNHWHLVLWPSEDGQLSSFMRWLTLTHAQRWHTRRRNLGSGHLYQGRFKSFIVQPDGHVLEVCRYIERDPLRTGLVRRLDHWRWSSLWQLSHSGKARIPIDEGPLPHPPDWLRVAREPQNEPELLALRRSIERGAPFGEPRWCDDMVSRFGLISTIRPRGRPRSGSQRRGAAPQDRGYASL
jgi:putative transposase